MKKSVIMCIFALLIAACSGDSGSDSPNARAYLSVNGSSGNVLEGNYVYKASGTAADEGSAFIACVAPSAGEYEGEDSPLERTATATASKTKAGTVILSIKVTPQASSSDAFTWTGEAEITEILYSKAKDSLVQLLCDYMLEDPTMKYSDEVGIRY